MEERLTKRVLLVIGPSQKAELEKQAKKAGVTMSAYIRQALKQVAEAQREARQR